MYIQEQPYRALGASPSPICPASTIKSTSFAEYVNLVRCAEMAFPNFNSGQMLSLLRQIYYGDEVWSFDRSPLWRDIIRCGSKISDDPRTSWARRCLSLCKRRRSLRALISDTC